MQVYADKKDCCGCGACLNICPKHAISMQEDEYGFIYPEINQTNCVNCGICKDVCAKSTHQETNKPLSVFAGISKNTDILQSASGGIFASLATSVINDGGIVCGVSMETINNILAPMHIMVDDIAHLHKLLGSKYVQSFTEFCFTDLKKYLDANRTVLFSGTPCQIAGLKGFLGKDYPSLFLVDIICHGVPGAKFFQDYIAHLEHKTNQRIIKFNFRDKRYGFYGYGTYCYKTNRDKYKYKKINHNSSSYYGLFLQSATLRESCYSCVYASKHRIGDISLGDFWGIETSHPDFIKHIKTTMPSCILVNSTKGMTLLSSCCPGLELHQSTLEKAALFNSQLNFPSKKHPLRETVFRLYNDDGYAAVEKYFKKRTGYKYYLAQLKLLIPFSIRKKVTHIIKNKRLS